ncbi:MAG TPA: diacylglycerol kinase [Chthonomonadales bacterium]|nr:diacylglycerol kinase [Chthonomonadales bacterium]
MRRKRPQDSLRHAVEGVLHCFRTQRHMQIHFLMLVLVLASGLMLALDPRDMVILLFCISLVIATEMVNTAVETVVDMVTQTYHPLAKLAKDVAAGAVLIASATATIAGVLILFGSEPLRAVGREGLLVQARTPDVAVVLVVGILVLTVTVVMSKLFQGRSNEALLRGGIVSGHSAIGFFLAMTIIFTSDNRIVQLIALLMAVIIAQSRVEAGVHSVQEVVLGAVVAVFLTSSVYWFMPMIQKQFAPPARPAHASTAWVETFPNGQRQFITVCVGSRSRT